MLLVIVNLPSNNSCLAQMRNLAYRYHSNVFFLIFLFHFITQVSEGVARKTLTCLGEAPKHRWENTQTRLSAATPRRLWRSPPPPLSSRWRKTRTPPSNSLCVLSDPAVAAPPARWAR